MKLTEIPKLFLLLFVTVLLVYCADQTLNFDEGDIPFREDSGIVVESVSFVDSSFVYTIDPIAGRGRSSNLILGEYEELKSSMLLRITNMPVNLIIESAALKMAPSFIYGEASEPFTAKVFEVTSDWDEVTPLEFEFDPDAIAVFEVGTSLADTDKVVLPSDIVQKWVDVAGDTTLPNSNYGILISFDNATFAKQYDQTFNDTDFPIVLSLSATQENDPETIIVDTVPPDVTTYTVDGVKDVSDDLIFTNFGSHRTIIRFDLDQIPEGAIINSAFLIMKLDESKSTVGIEETYSFQLSPIDTSSRSWNPGDLILTFIGFQERELVLVSEIPEVTFDFRQILQSWVIDKNTNFGILLSSASEGLDLSRFSFFLNTTDDNLRPHLLVRHTEFNPLGQQK